MENYCRILTTIPYKEIKEIKSLGLSDGYNNRRQITFIEGASDRYIMAFGQLYEASFNKGRRRRKERLELKDLLDLL